ncbi:PRC-barrel domain-containing protein [Alkalihalobacillus pseudalcaliphilus]|uniref:PRC-barrel domain-containing protein n=1 Tax=Alkalihalobacillus pseudalcaliphilus TaxID=79884 RepID=UPI00064E091D|nr:PRC-barrel domain-containing protein [Alkalihalobacillus pseudalcaliphilus]KMK76377.1 hypothetical protein AB990_14375 [Alkalihalobacillus pseudalcaliphilus]
MLIELSKLEKFKMKALDDELGSVDDIIFEGHSFDIRYVVADTRKWFVGGHVLLRMAAFGELNLPDELVSVNLTKEQIKNSPKPSDHEPFSRSFEQRLNDHYGWDHYWLQAPGGIPTNSGPTFVGRQAYVPGLLSTKDEQIPLGVDENEARQTTDKPSLQSFDHLNKFHVHAKNGEVGKLVDCIIDYNTSKIRYLIVDVGGFLSKELVAITPDMLSEISHFDRTITVTVEKGLIEEAPEFDYDKPFTRENEELIYRHYGMAPYWELSESTK